MWQGSGISIKKNTTENTQKTTPPKPTENIWKTQHKTNQKPIFDNQILSPKKFYKNLNWCSKSLL